MKIKHCNFHRNLNRTEWTVDHPLITSIFFFETIFKSHVLPYFFNNGTSKCMKLKYKSRFRQLRKL